MANACKRRALLRVPAGQLLEVFARQPERLWKRVCELEAAPEERVAIRQAQRDRHPSGRYTGSNTGVNHDSEEDHGQ
jgi:hypothetical protein